MSEPLQVWPKGSDSKHIKIPSILDLFDVKEMFSRYYVDPVIAQRNVPQKWRVKIHENGKAVLLLMVQESKKVVLDKVIKINSTGLSHLWIELEGLREVIPSLPGTSRSLPTWYWYVTPHQFDNPWAAALCRLVGVETMSVKSISLGGEPAEMRLGEVIEDESTGARYSWVEKSKLYPEPDIITGSHRLFSRFGMRESEAHVRCFTQFLGESEVTLNASSNSSVAKLGFGTSLSGFSNPVWFNHCRVKYLVGLF
jgi:hypothetical protein